MHQRDLVAIRVLRAIRAIFRHLLRERIDRDTPETALLEELRRARENEELVNVELPRDMLEVPHETLADATTLVLRVHAERANLREIRRVDPKRRAADNLAVDDGDTEVEDRLHDVFA